MLKNTASQVIGAQLVSATDGSAFTSAVTVAVTGDGGTQATGSVGAGACTHEGNGFHTYAPAQAETNYDHVAFTFTGSGAVPVTIQVYTGVAAITAPTNFSSLSIDASGNVNANVTEWLGTAPATPTTAGVPEVDVTHLGGTTQNVTDLNGVVDDLINGGRLDLLIDSIITAVADVPTNAELATALAAADDAVLAAIAALNNLSAATVATEISDALRTDTVSELSAVPAANATIATMLKWLYMLTRNRITQDGSEQTLYADDGTTAVAVAGVSDDATTFDKDEWVDAP